MSTTRKVAAVVAMLAAIGLVVSVAFAWPRLDSGRSSGQNEPGPPASAASPSSPSVTGSPPELGRSDAGLDSAAPTGSARPSRITLGSVDIDAQVRPVGVATDGQMQIPADPRVMGWYRFGAAPGLDGSVVVAGHLDSKRLGLGPLVRLRDVRVGDPVELALADGSTASYTVRSIERFDRQALPDEVFSRTGPERLRLVTCGGEYDADAGGYQQNLVVTAVPR